MNISFKYRFIISFVTLEFLFLVMVAYFNFKFIQSSSNKLIDNRIESIKSLTNQLLLIPVSIYDVATVDNILQSLLKLDNVEAARVINNNGLTLSSIENKNVNINKMMEIKIPLISDDTKFADFYMWLDFNKEYDEISEHKNNIIKLILLELSLSLLLAYFIGFKLSKNLEKLTKSVEVFGDNEKSEIISIKSKDEISILSNSMQNMQKKIEKRNNKLRELNELLDAKVHEEVEKNKLKDRVLFEQSKLASMGEMIGNIAHQWRQPLSVISASATGIIIQKKCNTLDEDTLYDTCHQINKNVQYLSKTIDDFRNFIKNDKTRVNFSIKDNILSLNELIEPVVKSNDINFKVQFEDININNYPNELNQCLINLFNNSKDAFLSNKIKLKYIFLEQSVVESNIVIKFKDNAGGVSDEILLRIFEPYFTTKHKSQGTGLGLHITYNLIVNGMQGTIVASNSTYEYENNFYSGLLFVITLPINID